MCSVLFACIPGLPFLSHFPCAVSVYTCSPHAPEKGSGGLSPACSQVGTIPMVMLSWLSLAHFHSTGQLPNPKPSWTDSGSGVIYARLLHLGLLCKIAAIKNISQCLIAYFLSNPHKRSQTQLSCFIYLLNFHLKNMLYSPENLNPLISWDFLFLATNPSSLFTQITF